jgi:hypothetical protein
MVSLAGKEEKILLSEYKGALSDLFLRYLTRVTAGDVSSDGLRGLYLGGWMDGEHLYLDLSENVLDKKTALFLAENRGQFAIFDVENGDSIYLSQELKGA